MIGHPSKLSNSCHSIPSNEANNAWTLSNVADNECNAYNNVEAAITIPSNEANNDAEPIMMRHTPPTGYRVCQGHTEFNELWHTDNDLGLHQDWARFPDVHTQMYCVHPWEYLQPKVYTGHVKSKK